MKPIGERFAICDEEEITGVAQCIVKWSDGEGGKSLGEGPDISDLRHSLLKRGVNPLEAERVAETFVTFPVGGERLMTWEQRESALIAQKRGSLCGSSKHTVADERKSEGPRSSGPDETKVAQTGVIVTEPHEADHEPAEWPEKDTAPVKGYVVSVSGKRKVRRLHYVGRCHRVPGVDFLDYVLCGEEQPLDTSYDDYCHQCWRAGPPVLRGDDSVVTESESSSTGAGGD